MMVPELKDLIYRDKIEEMDLPALEERSTLTITYKLIDDLDDIDSSNTERKSRF